jgi:sugar O-acyltransferase (sialic acid O-acetyltransferase NeuD family)
MKLPVILIGGGGHAKVLVEALVRCGREILGFTDPDATRGPVLGVRRLGGDQQILRFRPAEVRLINALGSIGSTALRKRVYEEFRGHGFHFESVIHPAAVVASGVELGEGVQVMAGTIVQAGCRVGPNTILNTGAIIDHDCCIGSHAHIAPAAVLCGAVQIADETHVGSGATVIQEIVIGVRSIIGAGAVVVKHVPDGVTAAGIPARILNRKNCRLTRARSISVQDLE